ncbi:NUDIX hydrolase [Herbidospora sp. RD11066]
MNISREILDEVAADAHRAILEFDDARSWFDEARHHPMDPLAAEVWVFDPAFGHVLLVDHPWRGWVPPGGRVEPGEAPRAAAVRECAEETGLRLDVLPEPAAVTVRSYRSDWEPSLGLTYVAVVGLDAVLAGEPGQPVAWFSLESTWKSVFPEDRERIRAYARRLGRPTNGDMILG